MTCKSEMDAVTITMASSEEDSICKMQADSNNNINKDNNENMEVDIAWILEQLSFEEIEIAAQASYEYRIGHYKNTNEEQQQQIREKYAIKMVCRYLKSKSERNKALKSLRSTIQFRNDTYMIKYMHDDNDTEDEEENVSILLHKFVSNTKSYVQGYDNNGRATILFIPRLVEHHDPIYTVQGHVWSIEKAIACSKHINNEINVVVDCTGFSLYKHSPPISIGKDVMITLRKHYVGSVHKIFILYAPSAFYMLWNIFKPFIGTQTKNKVQFVNDNEKDAILGEYYTTKQATSWMIPNGEKNRTLDVNEYLTKLPFNKSFDEEI